MHRAAAEACAPRLRVGLVSNVIAAVMCATRLLTALTALIRQVEVEALP
jgi:hypothetical protein